MAHLKKIQFERVGRNEGCTCDRCGQYIQNIWTVTFDTDEVIRFGIDCFNKLNGKALSDYGQKLMSKALKHLEKTQERFEKEAAKTEETDIAWQQLQGDDAKQMYWHGRPWKEYHEWMLTEWYGERFKECQKEIDRFGKVNYKL